MNVRISVNDRMLSLWAEWVRGDLSGIVRHLAEWRPLGDQLFHVHTHLGRVFLGASYWLRAPRD